MQCKFIHRLTVHNLLIAFSCVHSSYDSADTIRHSNWYTYIEEKWCVCMLGIQGNLKYNRLVLKSQCMLVHWSSLAAEITLGVDN